MSYRFLLISSLYKAEKQKGRNDLFSLVTNKVSGSSFSRYLTLAPCLHIRLQMLGEEQLIRELKLDGVNHDKVREWVVHWKAHIT
jgi:hypothetical protein